MAFNYDYNQNEYNVNGDAANGREGSYTQPSVINRYTQGGGQQQNPYGAILNYLTPPTGGAVNAPTGGNPFVAPNPGATTPTPMGGQSQPDGNGMIAYYQSGRSPLMIGNTDPGNRNVTSSPYNGSGQYTGEGTDAFNTGGGNVQHTLPLNQGPVNQPPAQNGPQRPPGVDDALWSDAQRYVQGVTSAGLGDASALLQHPELISQFRNWALDPAHPDRKNVDIVDWLRNTQPSLFPNLRSRSSIGDTYQTYQGGQGPSSTTPVGNVTAQQPNPSGNPAQFAQPQYPQAQNPSQLMALLQKLYSPIFQQGQTDLANKLAGQAALTGDLNSGGYGDVLGRQEGSLIGQQNAQLAGMLNTDNQNALDRALAQYQTETNSATSRYNADTGYATNAADNATRRYTGDQNYNLGLGDLGLRQYMFDNPSINQILGLYSQFSPEQLAIMGINGIPWPNQVYTHH